jgi:phage nucleotide-binding protein
LATLKKLKESPPTAVSRIRPVEAGSTVVSAMFYGKAGTGKTTVASTFPKPLLHLDIREKGTDSIVDVGGIDSVRVDSWDDIEELYWHVVQGKKYKTVVIDAVTQMQDLAIESVVSKEGREDKVMSKRMWGEASGKLKQWILSYRDLVDLGIHVVFLAHDRVSEGEDGEDGELMPDVGPRVMPSVASVMNAAVSVVGNTMIRELQERSANGKITKSMEYGMRLGPHAYYTTKIRSPKGTPVPIVLSDPTFEKIVSIIRGETTQPVVAAIRKRKK